MPNGDRIACPDDPRSMREAKDCLFAISKDLDGKIGGPKAEARTCKKEGCKTLFTAQSLGFKVTPNARCDSKESKLLDGEIEFDEFVHLFAPSGTGRGFHSGRFRWKSAHVTIEGEISGVSNAGLHRAPPHNACQKCLAPGVDEGRFCGTVVDTDQSELKEAQVFGAYLLKFGRPTAAKGYPSGAAKGTLEGVLIVPCN